MKKRFSKTDSYLIDQAAKYYTEEGCDSLAEKVLVEICAGILSEGRTINQVRRQLEEYGIEVSRKAVVKILDIEKKNNRNFHAHDGI